MNGLRRHVGRSASSRYGGLQESQYEEASDDYSSAVFSLELNPEFQDYHLEARPRTPDDYNSHSRAMRAERLGGIRAGMRALSRTILGSHRGISRSDADNLGDNDGVSSYSEDSSGDSDSDSSSYATGRDGSDPEDVYPGRSMSHATTSGIRRRRTGFRFDNVLPSLT